MINEGFDTISLILNLPDIPPLQGRKQFLSTTLPIG